MVPLTVTAVGHLPCSGEIFSREYSTAAAAVHFLYFPNCPSLHIIKQEDL
jgi:hypothetical protein